MIIILAMTDTIIWENEASRFKMPTGWSPDDLTYARAEREP